jgi:acylphosphatase
MEGLVCKHVRYAGRVQGVGFRYTAQRLAEAYSVSGFVRNLRDGDVELVAEGSADQVAAFLDSVARQMARNIERTTVDDATPSGFHGFRIRY